MEKRCSTAEFRLIEKISPISFSEKEKEALHLFKTATQSVSLAIDKLEKSLLNKCKVGFFEGLFKSEEYGQKMEAKKIVENAFKYIKAAIKEQKHNIVFGINEWTTQLMDDLIATGGINSPFIKKLAVEINNAINVDLKNELGYDFEQSNSQKIEIKVV